MDKITQLNKAVVTNTVTYTVRTEDGLMYQVIQRAEPNKNVYTECIYFITRGTPHLLRQCILPMHKTPEPDFKQFIEGEAPAH